MRGGTNYIPPHSLARLLSYLNAARDIMGRGSLPAHKSAREYIYVYVCVCVCVCVCVRRCGERAWMICPTRIMRAREAKHDRSYCTARRARNTFGFY